MIKKKNSVEILIILNFFKNIFRTKLIFPLLFFINIKNCKDKI